jgi:DNA topoisomerase-1
MPPKYVKKTGPKKTFTASRHEPDSLSSSKYLIIVESPSKCSKIEGFLGTDYSCIASIGHIRGVENGLSSIDKTTYEPTFSILSEKAKHIEFMRGIIQRFPPASVYLATDDDREGEAIAWHICQVFGLPVETTPRILFHEITKPAVLTAVKNPTIINMNLVFAQHARQVLDILVGFKISPYLWKHVFSNKSNSLSAGRCQTPALRLVYENQKEQDAGGGIETKYKTTGVFTSKNIKFDLSTEFDTQTQVLSFLELSKTHTHVLSVGPPKESRSSPPKPFHTSRLLQTASNMLHMSPKETMRLCQLLYQSGYITYMRTESSLYSDVFLEQATQYIKTAYSVDYVGDTDALKNKDAANPHEAIRVTHLNTTEVRADADADGGASSRLNTLYKLIWRNTVESCMSSATYKNVTVSITAPQESKYTYVIETPLFLGWKRLSEKNITAEEQNDPAALLLYVNALGTVGDVPYVKIESSVVVRNRHSHYTEASLIQKLEELGIGRPSTFASIVDTIQERGYVKLMDIEGKKTKCAEYVLQQGAVAVRETEKVFGNEKKKLVVQPVGSLVLEFLVTHFQTLFDYEYTKRMEAHLDDVSSGKTKDWADLCKTCHREIKDLATALSNVTKQAFALDPDHDVVFEKYGAVIKKTKKKDDGTVEYIPIKKTLQLDLERLKGGGYTLEELREPQPNYLGKYKGHDLYIKTGKFGPYAEWGETTKSIKSLLEETQKRVDEVTLADIEQAFDDPAFKIDKNVLRILNADMSVRKGKFGAYVYYKRADMKKPDFLNIKKFPEGYAVCSIETLVNWLRDTYHLPN